MFGLGFSLDIDSYRHIKPISSPNDLPECVTWYDFTDISTLRKNNDGTSNVTSNNDRIHWASNKANGQKLSNFIRSFGSGNDDGVTFKTGGQNGLSYAFITDNDGSDTSNLVEGRGLAAGNITGQDSDNVAWGGDSAGTFSSVKLDMTDMVVFFIGRNSIVNLLSGQNVQIPYSFQARQEGTTTNTLMYPYIHSSDRFYGFQTFDGGYTIPINTKNIDENVNLITQIRRDTSINDATIASGEGWASNPEYNNYVSVKVNGFDNLAFPGWSIFDGTVGDFSINDQIESMGITSNAANVPKISLGTILIGGDNAPDYNNGNPRGAWCGDIYEFVIYNRGLSLEEEYSFMKYVENKYNISMEKWPGGFLS